MIGSGTLIQSTYSQTCARVLLFGSVSATGSVAVTLLNHYGSTLNLGSGTLRIDVWQH